MQRKLDIVYSLCGSTRKEELLRSLTSLATLITAADSADSSTILVYNVHLITDGSIGFGDLPPILLATACFSLHESTSWAAPLFAPCSTQRLYLHELEGFDNVDLVCNTTISWKAQPSVAGGAILATLKLNSVDMCKFCLVLPASFITKTVPCRPSI